MGQEKNMIHASRVIEKCEAFRAQTQIRVTRPAQTLLTSILNDVVLDPHPSWKQIDRTERQRHAEIYLDRLPEMLGMLVEKRPGITVVTSFDILNEFSALCKVICFED